MKKNWRKPVIVELTAEQLSNVIRVAARSEICFGKNFR